MTQILVIDDDDAIRVLLTRTLQKQGYTVTAAKNGEEGLLHAQQYQPSLIISDWMMPEMDGLELCRRIKANPGLSTTFFILLTSRGATEDRVIGLDTGADEFLSKPIEMSELNARVRAGLRIHQLTQDLQTQKQILETELAEAADYVRSLLPLPSKTPVNAQARFIPSKQLGGDCFDYYWLDDDHLAIYLLDVSGHGVGAALLSVSMLNLLRSRSLPQTDFYQPNQVLNALNQSFQINYHQELYVDKYFTIWYGVYHRPTRQLIYASAGHPPAVLLSPTSSGKIQEQRLKTHGLPIGMFAEAEYICDTCKIGSGSTLYVFSDGVYEINQSDGTLWGIDAFIEALKQLSSRHPADLDRVLKELRSVNTKDTFDDDLSLLQIEFS